MEKKYNIVDGTYFDARTNPQVIAILADALRTCKRLRLYYGDTRTGRDWNERYDVRGTIGRSMGPEKIPLLIANSRSTGGLGILDHCIVRIDESKGGKVLYQHSSYYKD